MPALPIADRSPRTLDKLQQTSASVCARQWGSLPSLSLVAACGLLLVSVADNGSRRGAVWATPLFWLSLLVIFSPIVARLALGKTTRRETIGLVVVLGLALYLVKVLYSPIIFTLNDEFYHWRTTDDILQTGHLFHENPLLPVSALYPGMEIVTSALVHLSGLTIFSAGVILAGVIRLILILALYLLYEQVSGSTRVAGIGSVIYMANPNYLFFGAMFKYESLALAFAVLVLTTAVAREKGRISDRLGFTVVMLLALGVVVTTHHLTSYALSGFLGIWALVGFITRRRSADCEDDARPGGVALLSVVANASWLVFVATVVIGYLAPHVEAATLELTRMMLREQAPTRELFVSGSGQVAPLWERLTGFGAVGLLLLGLPFGLLQVWRKHRRSTMVLTLSLGALAYPVSLALRLTGSGWEIANRSSEFLFVALGLVVALGVADLRMPRRAGVVAYTLLATCATVIFVGGAVVGWTPSWRLPGPYQVQLGPRGIESEGLATASWVRNNLGVGNRFGAYGNNMRLLGAYGAQHISTSLSGGADMEWVLFAPKLPPGGRDPTLQRGQVHYLLVDSRDKALTQIAGRYYPGTPVDQALQKFDHVDTVSRLFDSGDIVIYDVSALAHVP